MSIKWRLDNAFKLSRQNYAPTVSTAVSGVSSVPSNESRRSLRSYYRSHPTDIKSIKSSRSSTYHSSLKSGRNSPYQFYESTESVLSTGDDLGPLESLALNPPKVTTKPWHQRPIIWMRLISICVLITVIILSMKYKQRLSFIFNPYLSIMESHRNWGITVFCIFLLLSIVLMLPQAMLIVDACSMMVAVDESKSRGIVLCIFIVWIINVVASIMQYYYGKLLRKGVDTEWMEKWKVMALTEEAMFDVNGWKFGLLLRVLPMNAYGFMNYMLGFTSLDLCGLIISGFGMLFNVIFYCLIGAFWKSDAEQIFFVTMILEVICCILPVLWWSLWLYWNISSEYDDARKNMLISHPSDILKGISDCNADDSFSIEEDELNDNVSSFMN